MFFNCKKEKENKPKIKFEKIESSRIEKLVELEFRRSYADHHLLSKKELDKLYDSEPFLEHHKKINLKVLEDLKKIKIVNENRLILKSFENNYSKDIKFLDAKNEISFNYNTYYLESKLIHVEIVKNNKLIEKKIDTFGLSFIGLLLKDVDNDGIKEILILLNSYMMNNHFYYLIIYKFIP